MTDVEELKELVVEACAAAVALLTTLLDGTLDAADDAAADDVGVADDVKEDIMPPTEALREDAAPADDDNVADSDGGKLNIEGIFGNTLRDQILK